MTDPNPPAPAAPAPAPTPQPAPLPVPAPAPPGPAPIQPAPAAFDPSSLTPEAQAYLTSQINAADLKARTGSKANAAAEAQREMAAKVAKALGITGDEPPDPEELLGQVQAAQDLAWKANVELAVHRTAGNHAGTLLDSLEFINSLDDIDEQDPSSPAFATALQAKVQEALAKRNLTAGQAPAGNGTGGQAPNGPRPDPSQGSRGTPPGNRPRSLSEAVSQHYTAR